MDRRIQKIACIGEVMIELATKGQDTKLGVAGDTYNTAVYLSQLLASDDAEVSYVTALGQDAFSTRILADMASHGIKTDKVDCRSDRLPGLYAIITDDRGERSFTYWRSESAARTLFGMDSAIRLDALFEFDLIFLSGITLAILPANIRAGLIHTLAEFRKSGGLVAFDSNFRPTLWENHKLAKQVMDQMWAVCDVALPSIDDEMEIFGETVETEVLDRFRKYGVMHGALKRGSLGPILLDKDIPRSNFPSVNTVVDSTAAGDSFNAGFLAEYIKGNEPTKAIKAGHDLASKVIQHQGAIIDI